MDAVMLLTRALLAAVFLVAGVAKLADRARARQALIDFGVPAVLARPLAVMLPALELAAAVALVPVPTAWWGGLGALALLLLFTVGISVNLVRGRKPDCHCFGQLASGPIGWPTLVRNGLLSAPAALIVWRGPDGVGPSAVAWLGALTLPEWVGLVLAAAVIGLVAAEGWLLIKVLGQNGRLLVRLESLEARLTAIGTVPVPVGDAAQPAAVAGLPVGTRAPGFSLSGLYGETLTLDALRAARKPVLLMLMDPDCGPCNALLPEVGRWQHERGNVLTIVTVSRGSADANLAKSTEYGLTHVLLQRDREVAEAYRAPATPSSVLVRVNGTIASHVAEGADAIRALVTQVAADTGVLVPTAPASANGTNGLEHIHHSAPPMPRGPSIGEPAPVLALPDLEGRRVDLADFRGRKTLVLFWNPTCGFCGQMLEDLKAWESRPPRGAPRLLVVSTGSEEANRAMGLRSTVILEPSFSAGFAFGVNATPSAVLVDAQGRIASEVSVGAPAVFALASGEQTVTQLPVS